MPYRVLYSVRSRSGQPYSPDEKWAIRASLRPLDNHEIAFGSQSCATRLVIGAFVFVASAAAFRRLGLPGRSFTGLADLAAIALVCYDLTRLDAKHSWLYQSDS